MTEYDVVYLIAGTAWLIPLLRQSFQRSER